jgi:hypothetical protein
MPVVAKTLRPCPEPKSTISGWTLTEAAFIHFCVNPAKKIWLHHQQLGGNVMWNSLAETLCGFETNSKEIYPLCR